MYGPHRSLPTADLEALRCLLEHGPQTIPQVYVRGHDAHGMNRLVAARYAVFSRWDSGHDDALWSITARGRAALARADEPNEGLT